MHATVAGLLPAQNRLNILARYRVVTGWRPTIEVQRCQALTRSTHTLFDGQSAALRPRQETLNPVVRTCDPACV